MKSMRKTGWTLFKFAVAVATMLACLRADAGLWGGVGAGVAMLWGIVMLMGLVAQVNGVALPFVLFVLALGVVACATPPRLVRQYGVESEVRDQGRFVGKKIQGDVNVWTDGVRTWETTNWHGHWEFKPAP